MNTKAISKKYKYIWLSLVVMFTWGLVPLFAKLGDLPGGQTTMWVNMFGTVGVLFIMTVLGKLTTIRQGIPYGSYVKLAVIWPLAYSIAYFSAIRIGGPSIATITNYTWPAFALIFAFFLLKKTYPVKVWLVVLLAILGVAIPVILEGNTKLLLIPVVAGIFAGITQAYFNVRTSDISEETTWVLTLVVQAVTAVGAGIYVALFENFQMPSTTTLWYLAYLGIIAGSIGFWAFINVSALPKSESETTTFYLLMCLTPLIQVLTLLIPIWHVESVSPIRWIGVLLVSFSYLAYKILTEEKKEQ